MHHYRMWRDTTAGYSNDPGLNDFVTLLCYEINMHPSAAVLGILEILNVCLFPGL